VRHVDTIYRRSGTLWEGRYRAAPIDSEAYFLACCRYIELNPVRARMVQHPRDYRWSSYRAHALGAADALLTAHQLHDALGATPAERQKRYGALFRAALDRDFVDRLRAALSLPLLAFPSLPPPPWEGSLMLAPSRRSNASG
jgi:putative transposase